MGERTIGPGPSEGKIEKDEQAKQAQKSAEVINFEKDLQAAGEKIVEVAEEQNPDKKKEDAAA